MGAGLGFKDFTTGEVLTANDVDGYLMQGVWVFADAAARTAAVTSPQEGNMSYLKDTNSTEYYSGSAWVAVAAAGGGMTQLGSTTTLSGASTLISSISGAYQKLFVEIIDFYMSANASLIVRFNSDATANAYQQVTDYYSAAVATAQQAPYLDKLTGMYATYGSVLNSDNNNYACFELPNYSSTMKKNYVNQSNYFNAGSNNTVDFARGSWFNTTAISSLLFVTSSGTFSGGTVKVWGIK
jgi:hypothetical protein